jgi:hypothetical protein
MDQEKDYTTSIIVDKSLSDVFEAINNVRGWWQGEITGDTTNLNDEFTYHMKPYHLSKQKIVQLIKDKKVVWLVTESSLSFVKKKDEWTGTTIEFNIEPEGNKTKLSFIHHGLVPTIECYGGCSSGWAKVVEKSLFNFINTGNGVDVF